MLDDVMNSSVFHPPQEIPQEDHTTEVVQHIATIVRDKRKEMGLSQSQLAQKTGLTQARISEVENGSRNYRIATLIKVLDALGFDLIAALENLPAEPAPPTELSGIDKILESLKSEQPPPDSGSIPHPNCYAIPGMPVLIGSYPGHCSKDKARAKLRKILDCGIDYFIDLTTAADDVEPYEKLLVQESGGKTVEYRSFPIEESSIPESEGMNEILNAMDAAVKASNSIYVHYRGGIGRAGTVAGCYLVRHGMSPSDALAEVQKLFETFAPERVAKHPEGSPQHAVQRKLVHDWASLDRPIHPVDYTAFQHTRYEGALVGLAAGDALGTTLEFTPHGRTKPIDDMVGGGPFGLMPGQWTDDTSMALCLGESLSEQRRFDPADQMNRYIRWYRAGHHSSTGSCFDIGNTIRDALERYERTGNPFSGPTDEHTAGNGSLMRLAPIAMFYAENPEVAIRMAAMSSRTTHGARAAVDACRYFAGLLVGALRGERREVLLAPMYSPVPELWEKEPLHPDIADIAAGSFKTEKAPPQLHAAGYVGNTLRLALWAFFHATDFRNGALRAVNIGGDADTTGAVYGQIAGAYFGLNDIPEQWRSIIVDIEAIEQMAHQLSWGPFGLSPVREAEAHVNAKEFLAWGGGSYEDAIRLADRCIDEAAYGSMAVQGVMFRAKQILTNLSRGLDATRGDAEWE
jgi:ADP-ribosyl-[dinitrogen reductase] hydrolase